MRTRSTGGDLAPLEGICPRWGLDPQVGDLAPLEGIGSPRWGLDPQGLISLRSIQAVCEILLRISFLMIHR